MPDINVDVGFPGNKKVRFLRARCGETAEVYPLRLWCYIGLHQPADPKLIGFSDTEVEGLMEWRGESGVLVAALLDPKISFLDRTENGFIVRGWKEHQGHLVANKKRAEKAAKARWDKVRSGFKSKSAQATAKSSPSIKEPSPAVREFMRWILKTYVKLDLDTKDPGDLGAVKIAINQYQADAEIIMAAVRGDLEEAKNAALKIGKYFERQRKPGGAPLAWNLGTIAKHALEWKANPDAYEVSNV